MEEEDEEHEDDWYFDGGLQGMGGIWGGREEEGGKEEKDEGEMDEWEEVRPSEKRSDELATPSLVMYTARSRTSVQDTSPQ